MTTWWRLRGQARHNTIVIPHIGGLLALVAAVVALYIGAALLLIPGQAPREFHFINERGAITALSAVFLAMASGFAGACATQLPRPHSRCPIKPFH